MLDVREVTGSSPVSSTNRNPLNRNGLRGFLLCLEVAFEGCPEQVFGALSGQFGAIFGAQKRGPPACRGPPIA